MKYKITYKNVKYDNKFKKTLKSNNKNIFSKILLIRVVRGSIQEADIMYDYLSQKEFSEETFI